MKCLSDLGGLYTSAHINGVVADSIFTHCTSKEVKLSAGSVCTLSRFLKIKATPPPLPDLLGVLINEQFVGQSSPKTDVSSAPEPIHVSVKNNMSRSRLIKKSFKMKDLLDTDLQFSSAALAVK